MVDSSLDFETFDEEAAALLSASITDEQLQSLAGTRDLANVRFLQMAVDSEFVPLSCIGERLPQLEQLKLNGSSLPSLRYLGTSMTRLRVLWLCRCGLHELDNLSALPELQELYLAFNDIQQLSPLTESEQLQVLDLEANRVADIEQVEFLQFVPTLQELTLRGNPVVDGTPDFRQRAVEMLPHLELLDDEPTDGTVADDAALDGMLRFDAAAELAGLEGELGVAHPAPPTPGSPAAAAAARNSGARRRRRRRAAVAVARVVGGGG